MAKVLTNSAASAALAESKLILTSLKGDRSLSDKL